MAALPALDEDPAVDEPREMLARRRGGDAGVAGSSPAVQARPSSSAMQNVARESSASRPASAARSRPWLTVSMPSLCSRDRSLRTETSNAYSGRVEITRADDVRAILGDPAFLVPPAPPAAGGGVAWLRASVGRFANGETHARRRALGAAALARLDCGALEREACAHAERLLGTTGRKPFDLMARIARPATVEVLADALGLRGVAAADVALAARAYPGAKFDKKTDAAVERLVAVCGGAHDEATAASIGLLVQACDATAGLAANALIALLTSARGGSPAALVSRRCATTRRCARPAASPRHPGAPAISTSPPAPS